MLIETAATLDQAFFYKDVNYGGYSSGLPAGNYTLANLISKGILNEDITSFTLPPGYEVTFYEHDNFTGASVVKTASQSWIGADWNDRVSSLSISHVGGENITSLPVNANTALAVVGKELFSRKVVKY